MKSPQSDLQDEFYSTNDFISHIGHWLEYLSELRLNADQGMEVKLNRQIQVLLEFFAGTNCNIDHNELLQHYYTKKAKENDEKLLVLEPTYMKDEEVQSVQDQISNTENFVNEFRRRLGATSMAVYVTEPIQKIYKIEDPAFELIRKVLASESLFFLQGPPGTGKTTAIVEIILQYLKAKPDIRILISSETHVAVDNALDRLIKEAPPELIESILRYPSFRINEFECETTPQTNAVLRADALWRKAHKAAPELTKQLWVDLHSSDAKIEGDEPLDRWQTRNLGEMHQVIGVTCNQINHLMDGESQPFDLAIVDECSKATTPEWLMAMGVARKCVLVGDHKQLPPTFCEEESEVLKNMDRHKERLIRNGVIDRLFENLPADMKGTLRKQFRMLPKIGEFISHHFYESKLEHHRLASVHGIADFGWLTYRSNGFRFPAQRGTGRKILINDFEVQIIMKQLVDIDVRLKRAKGEAKVSVALITPYRAQREALIKALKKCNLSKNISVEIETVDAFQGRQADIVFFSFVRNTGPATFYADERRLNVAISRACDSLYLVGDVDYISKRQLPVLEALAKLPILISYNP